VTVSGMYQRIRASAADRASKTTKTRCCGSGA
jgi:hypothetical protein